MSILDAFGRVAATSANLTVAAGRYAFQSTDEANIVPDIVAKLRLGAHDTLLEIGCGTGNLLLPLAGHVAHATGVDHASCLDRVAATLPDNVSVVPGAWPGAPVMGPFTRVLVYSVLHYLEDADAATEFIDAAFDLLSEDGWMLVGDLPNRDAAGRFGATDYGRRFTEAWRRRVAGVSDEERERDLLLATASAGARFIDDAFVLATSRRLRRRGAEAYVVPQPSGLPFGHTREDLLIHRRRA